MEIKMHSVVSSYASKVGYDKGSKTLAITFPNGATYHYDDVPETIYSGIFKSESVGKYLQTWVVRKGYQSRKLEPKKLI
jgi:hypothetical protein